MKEGLANSNCIVQEFESRVLPGRGFFYKFLYFAFHFSRREGWARTRLMGRTENCGLLTDVYCIGTVLRNSTDCARGTRKVRYSICWTAVMLYLPVSDLGTLL